MLPLHDERLWSRIITDNNPILNGCNCVANMTFSLSIAMMSRKLTWSAVPPACLLRGFNPFRLAWGCSSQLQDEHPISLFRNCVIKLVPPPSNCCRHTWVLPPTCIQHPFSLPLLSLLGSIIHPDFHLEVVLLKLNPSIVVPAAPKKNPVLNGLLAASALRKLFRWGFGLRLLRRVAARDTGQGPIDATETSHDGLLAAGALKALGVPDPAWRGGMDMGKPLGTSCLVMADDNFK